MAYGYNANGDLVSDGLKSFSYNAQGRLSAVTTGATDTSPTTRYAHNALGQRVFKTEPLYPPAQGDEANPTFMQSLIGFFTKLWGPSTSDAERLGFAYMYDEAGNLLSETGTGGANSTGSTMHIYLPTATGAMPVAAIVNGQMFAVHSDHLNTPRKITNSSGQVVWQWAYSAFGEDEPTIAAKRFTNANTVPANGSTGISPIVYNVGYMGQYRDKESGLAQNWYRFYDKNTGRYVQTDPIGLLGGFNRYPYANLNPLIYVDPMGLMGVGSGLYGVPNAISPPSLGANFTVGAGGSCHTPFGFGIGADAGLVRDTRGNTCFYSNVCYTVGPGMSAGLGVVGSAGSGPALTGVTMYEGATWTGGAGLMGSGAVLFGNDGSAQVGRGFFGVGAGASATYQACRQQYTCLNN